MAVTKQQFDPKKIIPRRSAEKLTVTILSGGPSNEREISLQSGRAVAAALESIGHTVHLEDIAPENLAALARDVDCVFIALHGAFGEDGRVQAILEKRGLCYCGSGPEACALAIHKARAKARFAELGLPTPRYAVATEETIREAMAAWTLPLVVKPVQGGSSLDCHMVRDVTQFRPAIEQVLDACDACLVESYVPGREITVSILGDAALPPIEIRTRRDFYDYDAKYVDEDTEFLFDIDLPPDLLDRIVEMSLAAHRGLGCRDFSRVDWRVDDTRMAPQLLEVNVIPGLTSHSLLPKAAARAGLELPAMYQHLIDLAIKRKFAK